MTKKKNGKKLLSLLAIVFIVGSLLVACGSKRDTLNNGVNGEEVTQEETKPEVRDSNELQFNLDSTNIQSLEYRLPYDGEMKEIEITNKEDLSKVIEYLNSLSLPATSERPKDAINKFSFKDDNGNVIKEFSFGDSGVLWVINETYILGSSNINTLKNLLSNIEKAR
jgi:hypothetical protein